MSLGTDAVLRAQSTSVTGSAEPLTGFLTTRVGVAKQQRPKNIDRSESHQRVHLLTGVDLDIPDVSELVGDSER